MAYRSEYGEWMHELSRSPRRRMDWWSAVRIGLQFGSILGFGFTIWLTGHDLGFWP